MVNNVTNTGDMLQTLCMWVTCASVVVCDDYVPQRAERAL